MQRRRQRPGKERCDNARHEYHLAATSLHPIFVRVQLDCLVTGAQAAAWNGHDKTAGTYRLPPARRDTAALECGPPVRFSPPNCGACKGPSCSLPQFDHGFSGIQCYDNSWPRPPDRIRQHAFSTIPDPNLHKPDCRYRAPAPNPIRGGSLHSSRIASAAGSWLSTRNLTLAGRQGPSAGLRNRSPRECPRAQEIVIGEDILDRCARDDRPQWRHFEGGP